jgi:enoyl-CoA hydratase/carnithine racemase
MAYENIEFEVKKNTGFIYINRPKVLNALDEKTMSELKCAFSRMRDDKEVRVVILTGRGEKAFVAGADISQFNKFNTIQAKEFAECGQKTFDLIENLGKPVIAAVNGFALGGGCELAMACTLRIASDNAKFGQPEINLGLIPGYGGTQRLPRLIGKTKALELILTGDIITANDAMALGIVNRVVPQADLFKECEALADKIASKSPVIAKLAIESINRGLNTAMKEGCEIEASLFGACFATKDKIEGVNAFLEKRKPAFTGE